MSDPIITGMQSQEALLDAILRHVPFDGWSERSLSAAITDAGLDPVVARGVCPRGALDLAVAYHARGDAEMVQRLRAEDLSQMRFRDRVMAAVRFRIEAIHDREAARRAASLFSLPQHAAEGAKLIWGTADRIWDTLGDRSDDHNWYTKRATLSGVYSATLLYWLGDDSAEHQRTWRFLERRIDDVMQIEKIKAQLNRNPVAKRLLAGPNWVLSQVRAPARTPKVDLPGTWSGHV